MAFEIKRNRRVSVDVHGPDAQKFFLLITVNQHLNDTLYDERAEMLFATIFFDSQKCQFLGFVEEFIPKGLTFLASGNGFWFFPILHLFFYIVRKEETKGLL